MAIGPRLDLRPSQSLVMTPQLQQAIKLLALSNLELEAFLADAVEANPLVELAGRGTAGEGGGTTGAPSNTEPNAAREALDGIGGDWGTARPRAAADPSAGQTPFAERAESVRTLADDLQEQLSAAGGSALHRQIARHLVGHLDDAGYLAEPLPAVAAALGASLADAEAALALLQSLEPTGVGARDLAECLALQAREADRYDPCMRTLIANLDLLAKGNFAQLRRICGVDEEDFGDMVAELRRYDPKPGLTFGGESAPPATPDIFVRPAANDGWSITLNRETLPRLVVDRDYYLELHAGPVDRATRAWLTERLSDANWLIKALDQRQKTILRVSHEIVRRQQGFFQRGVSALIPLTLREVAEAVDMHESTISRVAANKFLNCPRGTFELRYFFSSGVAAASEEGAASAEAVKAAIRALIASEQPGGILSDDALVEALGARGYTIARRTVAKYREAIGLGSSVERRRQKALAGVAGN